MGIYDAYNDTPSRIKTEGETITLAFQQGEPAVGQGTVSWNIPNSGTDNTPGGPGAYAGIIVVVSDMPLNAHNMPRNGIIYTADPTVNKKLHTGDKIGNAIVVGAFYERVKVGQNKPLTTSLIINDLQANIPYYVGAFAVDSEFRYHTEGVRAYSDQITGHHSCSVPARQLVRIGTPDGQRPLPIHPSAGTGLIPRQIYQFDCLLANTYPHHPGRPIRISLDGLNAQTYGDLVTELNKRFSLVDCPPEAPVSPGTNQLYWDTANQKLYQLTFNPTTLALTLTPIPNVIVRATDPTQVAAGTYWYNPSTLQMFVRIGTSPGTWQQVTIINYGTVNPTALTCDDFWIQTGVSPVQGYNWNGSAWCSVPTIESSIDPACPPANLCGSYWFDSAHSALYRYDADTSSWVTASAIVWSSPPNNLPMGTYWFDLITNTLHIWTSSTSPQHWMTLSNVIISTTQPSAPATMSYWYNPTTEVLQQFNGTAWTLLTVLVWPGDPSVVSSCDLWWNHATSPGTLNVWDVVNQKWTPVVQFFDQPTDPRLAPVIAAGTLWYNPSTQVTQRWDGSSWNAISVVQNSYDPTKPHTGDVWFNPVNHTWYVWGGSSWVAINPLISSSDPTMLPAGWYWYNTINNSLQIWNGTAWVSVAFTTTIPYPPKNQIWYNTTDGKLYRWNSDTLTWCFVPPIVHVTLDLRGFIVFTTRDAGSGIRFKILYPAGFGGPGGTGHADFESESIPSAMAGSVDPPLNAPLDILENNIIPGEVARAVSNVSEDAFLFFHLIQGAKVLTDILGADGVSDVPSYLELGVGTDGTPDERRQLADTIRRQLGYPAVDVELDKKQMNDCISFALQQFRQKSSLSYKRAFFFLDMSPGQQKYILSNRQLGYHKIVNVTACHRFTSAFLATANGSGVYGQMVLQHLYNMGTYDLTSYYLVSNYVSTMELLFATRLTFSFDESSRLLHLYNTFTIKERILMDCTVEKTEQEILKHRLSANWIREWAMSEAMMILSQIRGKYASLPGAGGGVSLNSSELRDRAEKIQEKLLGELDDYQAQDVESLGYNTQFVIG